MVTIFLSSFCVQSSFLLYETNRETMVSQITKAKHRRTNSDPTKGSKSRKNINPIDMSRIEKYDTKDDLMQRLTQSLSTFVYKYGENHPKVSQLRNSIGNLYFQRGDLSSAEEQYSRVLTNVRKHGKRDDIDMAVTLRNLGTLQWKMGNYPSSIRCLEESLRIYMIEYGGDDENEKIAESLHNLGLARFLNNELDQSQGVLEKALVVRKKIFGDFNVEVARTLDALGKVYLAKGYFSLAMNSHFEALNIKNEILGKENQSSVISLMNLAHVYRCKGEFNHAIELYKEALRIKQDSAFFDKGMDAEIGTTLHIIGDIQAQKSSYFGALSSFREASLAFEHAGLRSDDTRVLALNNSTHKTQRLLEASDLFLIREQSVTMLE